MILLRIINRLAAFFVHIWRSILSLSLKAKSSYNNEQPTPLMAPPLVEAALDTDDPYEGYTASIGRLNDIVVKLGLHERMSASQKYMYEMGRRDGALGIKMDITGIARTTSHDTLRHISVILKGQISALTSRLAFVEKIMKDDEKTYQLEQKHYDHAKYQYRFFPKHHSILLFLIYSVVAIVLVAADLPLALKLIQNGFDLEGPGFEELFTTGNFWNVIAANWETTVTATGIAFCTVYIKIFYDEFVGTPFGNKFMMHRRFYEENEIDHSHNEAAEIRKESKFKRVMKIILLGITLIAILVLAFFRLETAAQSGEALTPAACIAFVFITLLFPVIGGVCLSYALSNLQNRKRLLEIKFRYASSRRRMFQSVEQYMAVRRSQEDLLAASERLGDEQKIVNEYMDYLTAYYKRGYAIGGMQPTKYATDEDFYTRILEWRDVAVSRKISYNIEKFN